MYHDDVTILDHEKAADPPVPPHPLHPLLIRGQTHTHNLLVCIYQAESRSRPMVGIVKKSRNNLY